MRKDKFEAAVCGFAVVIVMHRECVRACKHFTFFARDENKDFSEEVFINFTFRV